MEAPRLRLGAIIGAAFVLAMAVACGESRPDGAAQSGASKDDDVVGVWEHRYVDAVGQAYLDLFWLREDGTYLTQIQGAGPDDRGRYVVEGASLGLRSDINQAYSKDYPFSRPDGDTLRLTQMLLGPVDVDWKRSDLKPILRIARHEDRDLPGGLAGVMAAALTSQAKPWRDDALPTAIFIEPRENGTFETVMHFYSPSTEEEMRLRFGYFDYEVKTFDGSRAFNRPLPPNFVDLPLMIDKAAEHGFDGALKKASLRSFAKHGAAWMASFEGARQGTTISAETGALINEDVTGYIDQYNADWKAVGEIWAQVAAQNAPKTSEVDDLDWITPDCGITCHIYDNPAECRNEGGSWSTQSGCY
ncbi:MAG: hypothetical protein AAGL49_03065 [Pseudomonadota bacterium]